MSFISTKCSGCIATTVHVETQVLFFTAPGTFLRLNRIAVPWDYSDFTDFNGVEVPKEEQYISVSVQKYFMIPMKIVDVIFGFPGLFCPSVAHESTFSSHLVSFGKIIGFRDDNFSEGIW